ncbi:MAG: nitronate monooxygenase [Crocinitomicaceae bacterium]|nr:nitronate monooxygenase [Crocinitomicaceae bacterium]MDG1734908.1 nitronate monooxygenase [Crocinitomicaceae bacterium]MDG2504679.1 nitronate monooxygenase [Crocinitomicaceae bacterium]
MKNRITELFNIEYPIIQAGMIWCSGWKLASAVSNTGGLGIIGSGSMYPQVLDEHILKCKNATSNPFAVNLPMLYPNIEEHIETIIRHKVPIVFTSAGNPKLYTSRLQSKGITVVHVVSSLSFAKKAQEAGVDAIVAEGFEAGGHNGRDETTTLCLIPMVKKEISIPIIAAGGIATGQAMLACMALGAEGFQIGSRFVACNESSAHTNFKQAVINAKEGDTELTLKELTPVRLLKNNFHQTIKAAYNNNASKEELQNLLGRGRAKKGMFEGDLDDGELEIGQIAGLLDNLKSAEEIVKSLVSEFNDAKNQIINTSF